MTYNEIIFYSTALVIAVLTVLLVVSFCIYKIKTRNHKPKRYTFNEENGFCHDIYEKKSIK